MVIAYACFAGPYMKLNNRNGDNLGAAPAGVVSKLFLCCNLLLWGEVASWLSKRDVLYQADRALLGCPNRDERSVDDEDPRSVECMEVLKVPLTQEDAQ